jgi:TolB-like protein/DNA-binding winged helix-turn-helix (wHTH) protein/Flp pilus assembly protein TadD
MNSRVTIKNFGFGAFRLDATHRLLKRASSGEVVPLTPKAFELLLILVESKGRLLTKADLMNRVWAESFVEEGNLTQTVSVLRKALGEQPHEHHYIVTEPGQGYRFVAEVREAEVDAAEGADEWAEEISIDATSATGATDITEDRTKHDEPNITAPAPTLAPSVLVQKKVMVAAVGFGVVFLLVLTYWLTRPPPPKTITEVKSIAVLPFKNIGGKADEEYLGQGLAEVLITKLSNIKTIVVRPNSAVMKYGEASPEPKRIGSELNVEAVVMGHVQKVNENIRVTVQLVRASDGATLWAETFDDKFTNIFGVQDSIATQVTNSLSITLTTGEHQQITKRFTNDTEAFQLYLQGRYFWNKRTAENIQKAIEYFTRATEKDPKFALAYSGLADSYMLLGINDYLGTNPRDAIPQAKAAANKALALDDTLAEAHTSLGFMSYVYDFDWVNSERHFRRAIELNPNYATAHHWYALSLSMVKRFEESEEEIRKALQLDPSSLIINNDYGDTSYYSRRYDQAVAQYKKTVELEPRFALAHQGLGRVYAEQKRYDEAIAEFNQAMEISGRRPGLLALLGYAYGMSGRKTEAERILHELKSLGERQSVLPFNFTRVYIGLNDQKKAMEWMEKNFKERQYALIILGVEPAYDSLRDEPRFQEMLKELKLDQGGERRR